MIDINRFYTYVNWLSAKDLSGGYLPPDIFNLVVPICVNQLARKYIGVPEQYQPGMPLPAIAYEQTQLITDYLSELKVELPLVVDASGKASKPQDYLYKSSLAVSWAELIVADDSDLKKECDDCDGNPTIQNTKKYIESSKVKYSWSPVTVVSDAKRWAYLQSSLREPSKKYPICVFADSRTLQFYPKDIRSALFIYLRYPVSAKWNYNVGTDDYPVYTISGSKNIELPEICTDELAATVLTRMGISIREAGLVDWANYVKKTGL